jgi:hypothetical protein
MCQPWDPAPRTYMESLYLSNKLILARTFPSAECLLLSDSIFIGIEIDIRYGAPRGTIGSLARLNMQRLGDCELGDAALGAFRAFVHFAACVSLASRSW